VWGRPAYPGTFAGLSVFSLRLCFSPILEAEMHRFTNRLAILIAALLLGQG